MEKALESKAAHLKLAKALAHPLRLKILGTLSAREISPSEFAKEVGKDVSNVSYHFRVLAKLGFAEVTQTRSVRGSTEHTYRSLRPVVFEDAISTEMPPEMRRMITETILQDYVGRMVQAIQQGTFDARNDRHFTWTPLVVDEMGWEEAMSLLGTTFEGLASIKEKAGKRLAESNGQRLAVTIGLAGFESPMETKKRKAKKRASR
jgi:DNA-binding transcriptional ArsR family regulator